MLVFATAREEKGPGRYRMEEQARPFEKDLPFESTPESVEDVQDPPASGARLRSDRHQSPGGKRAAREIALMDLPEGYRLLVTAPNVWVLVDMHSAHQVVARYHGGLVAREVERAARQHATRGGEEGAGHTDAGDAV